MRRSRPMMSVMMLVIPSIQTLSLVMSWISPTEMLRTALTLTRIGSEQTLTLAYISRNHDLCNDLCNRLSTERRPCLQQTMWQRHQQTA
ncbi:hypothetical protein BKA62DRAFT_686446 [Auriculariales sp. MPI-PUGE-AT-0066]|nr:hypothetical protein BKA62DRAFT_686446 [Auriculariales sp. MPI-PUGE-AT-0066]